MEKGDVWKHEKANTIVHSSPLKISRKVFGRGDRSESRRHATLPQWDRWYLLFTNAHLTAALNFSATSRTTTNNFHTKRQILTLISSPPFEIASISQMVVLRSDSSGSFPVFRDVRITVLGGSQLFIAAVERTVSSVDWTSMISEIVKKIVNEVVNRKFLK